MALDVVVRLDGLVNTQARLGRLLDLGQILAQPLRDSCNLLAGDLRRYPPLSEANFPPTPPPGRFYIRGQGLFYVNKRGVVRRVALSERLGISWYTTYALGPDLVRGIVANGVSYGPYVHGLGRQAAFHARRGWRTTQAVVDRLRPTINALFVATLRRAIT